MSFVLDGRGLYDTGKATAAKINGKYVVKYIHSHYAINVTFLNCIGAWAGVATQSKQYERNAIEYSLEPYSRHMYILILQHLACYL